MLDSTLRFMKRQPAWRIFMLACAVLLLLAYLDWINGANVRIGIFYLIPVTLITLFVGRAAGVVISILSATVWLITKLVDPTDFKSPFIAYTNALLLLAFFLFSVVLLSMWREIGERLERLVTERTAALSEEVAERKQAEQALHMLALRLADAEDSERRQLAHDIHDAIGQTLSVMKFRLDSAAHNPEGSQESSLVADCLDLVNSLITQTRTLTFELHPPMLDHLGLAAALQAYAKEFRRQTGVEMTVAEKGNAHRPSESISSFLFRSVKELANNALKHGHATEIFVFVHWGPADVRVVMDDNGSGFDASAEAPNPAGLGLAGIRERTTTLGGRLDLESKPQRGCRAILQVPL